MNIQPLATASEPHAPRILIVAAAQRAHHPFLATLTAPPSLLGSHYLVVTETIGAVLAGDHEPFSLILVEYADAMRADLDALRARAAGTPLLVVVRYDAVPPVLAGSGGRIVPHVALRSAVAQILQHNADLTDLG